MLQKTDIALLNRFLKGSMAAGSMGSEARMFRGRLYSLFARYKGPANPLFSKRRNSFWKGDARAVLRYDSSRSPCQVTIEC
jgi:hypothetical protein